MKTGRMYCMLSGMIVVLALLAMAAPAAADPWIGGDPLVTANGSSGMVTGDLWFDDYPGFDYAYSTPIVKNFTLPCSAANVAWARLYVDAYIGNMQNNYPLNVTVEFNGGSGYETLGSEIMNTTYTFPENDGSDGTIWINDHCNRVTSDLLMWYDVTDNITSSNVQARVRDAQPDGSQPFDGRIKMITLLVAYNNASTGKEIRYWVNQGHDTDSYLADDNSCSYTGSTTFAIPSISPGTANLTPIYLASFNGNYTFNNSALSWANPQQGPYFGYQSWNVTSQVSESSDRVMTFDRNATDSGSYSGYFKIVLALLTVENRKFTYDFSDSNTYGKAGTTLKAYKGNVSAQPPSATNVPTTEITSYSNIASDNSVYESTTTGTGYAAHRFEFTINQSASDVACITATWVGKCGARQNGEHLYIWNATASAYEDLDNCSNSVKTTLSGTKTTGLNNYIDGNRKVILLVVQNKNGGSTLETDYVKLEVIRTV